MVDVSIIILSYNTEELLKQCLTSIYLQVKHASFEVIVVDNASNDSSVSMIKKHFPQIVLIQNKENAGFAKGCNIGARKAKGHALLFLNSDTLMKNDAISPLLTVLNENHAGVVGGILENNDGSVQRSFGAFYTLPNTFQLLFGGEKNELRRFFADKIESVDWVSGGFMLIRKDLFETINGFDEHFFMYIEDMELCYRVRKAGQTVYVTPDSTVAHVGQGSSNKTFAIVSIYKGLQYFYRKHRSAPEYYMLKLLLGVKAVLVLIISLVTGNVTLRKTYLQALQTL